MPPTTKDPTGANRELVLTRLINASRDKLFRT